MSRAARRVAGGCAAHGDVDAGAAAAVESQHGVLAPGAQADFVHLGDDLELRGVWFSGEPVEA